MTSGEANIRGDCIINPRASGGRLGPQTPAKIHFHFLHQTLPCKVKHGGDKPFLFDILLIFCSVMGINLIIVKIISLDRKSSKVAEVKKSLATFALIGEMASKR